MLGTCLPLLMGTLPAYARAAPVFNPSQATSEATAEPIAPAEIFKKLRLLTFMSGAPFSRVFTAFSHRSEQHDDDGISSGQYIESLYIFNYDYKKPL
jgi:hypothetical protein